MIKAKETSQNLEIELIPSQNLYAGHNSLIEHFQDSTSLETDLLNVASGIYAIDLAFKRLELEQYIRSVEVTIDVVNWHAFERIREALESALFILSGDNWTIKFNRIDGKTEESIKWPEKDGIIQLFSGGIDSFCGAVHYINQGDDVILVSHVNQNKSVSGSQQLVHKVLEEHFSKEINYYPYRIFARNKDSYSFPEMQERENTQRTRSFLFVALAVMTARRVGFRKIISMAENGQFAIHLPLNQSRVGPFSTHTANPKFLVIAKELFSTLLDLPDLDIVNPFLYKTKAEVTSVLTKDLLNKIDSSVSCWMASHVQGKNHCGRCIPCLTRRIAIEYNGLSLDEYQTDIFNTDLDKLDPSDDGKRNLIDFLEFLSKFKTYDPNRKEEFMFEFPELYNDAIDEGKALEMYKNVAIQSFTVFNNYPRVMKYL